MCLLEFTLSEHMLQIGSLEHLSRATFSPAVLWDLVVGVDLFWQVDLDLDLLLVLEGMMVIKLELLWEGLDEPYIIL